MTRNSLPCSHTACKRLLRVCSIYPLLAFVCAVACPNACSGNGQCVLITDLENVIEYPDTNWDAKRIETCKCDAGFGGPDCSLRKLTPSG